MKQSSHIRMNRRGAGAVPMHDPVDLSSQLSEIARVLERHSRSDGSHTTLLPRVSMLRQSAPTGQPIHSLHEPAMCLIVQGAKQVILNEEVYSYDASRYLVVSLDVPITAQVTRASSETPYLCFRLGLDAAEIAALILETGMTSVPDRSVARALMLAQTSTALLDAVLRLTRLLDTPEDIAALAPLAVREILYRLLKSEQGPQLRQIAATDGQTRRISRVISWLKQHFDQPLRIDDIAREVHMSPSSLHHHFKAITAMSPLQFQKQLRLQEARRLMLVQDVDAATAGHRVGYESPSQFGREYARLFGAPPARDLRRLREQMPAQGTYG
jgi:AraC-like DNA-binding protein